MTSTGVAPPAIWWYVPTSMQVTGTVFTVTAPLGSAAGFYRWHGY